MSASLSLHCHPAVTPVTAAAFLEDWLLYGEFNDVNKYFTDSTEQQLVTSVGIMLELKYSYG